MMQRSTINRLLKAFKKEKKSKKTLQETPETVKEAKKEAEAVAAEIAIPKTTQLLGSKKEFNPKLDEQDQIRLKNIVDQIAEERENISVSEDYQVTLAKDINVAKQANKKTTNAEARLAEETTKIAASKDKIEQLEKEAETIRLKGWVKKDKGERIKITLPGPNPDSAPITVKATILAEKKLGKGGSAEADKLFIQFDDNSFGKVVRKTLNPSASVKSEWIEGEDKILQLTGYSRGSNLGSDISAYYMEYLGKKVTDFVDKNHPDELTLNKHQKYVVIKGLLESLEKLHALGVIHGDIGLHNLAFRKGRETAALFDFGLSVLEGESKGPTGDAFYMAPEVLSGKEHHSYKSDTYAAGVTIAILLGIVGHESINDTERGEIKVAKIWNDEKFTTRTLVKSYDLTEQQAKGLYALVDGMTKKDPKERITESEAMKKFNSLELFSEQPRLEKMDIYTPRLG